MCPEWNFQITVEAEGYIWRDSGHIYKRSSVVRSWKIWIPFVSWLSIFGSMKTSVIQPELLWMRKWEGAVKICLQPIMYHIRNVLGTRKEISSLQSIVIPHEIRMKTSSGLPTDLEHNIRSIDSLVGLDSWGCTGAMRWNTEITGWNHTLTQ